MPKYALNLCSVLMTAPRCPSAPSRPRSWLRPLLARCARSFWSTFLRPRWRPGVEVLLSPRRVPAYVSNVTDEVCLLRRGYRSLPHEGGTDTHTRRSMGNSSFKIIGHSGGQFRGT